MNRLAGVANEMQPSHSSVQRPRRWVIGLALMLGWFVLWMLVATTVYRVESVETAFLGAAVSFFVVTAGAGGIMIKRLHDRALGH
jgi:hypothetical protein